MSPEAELTTHIFIEIGIILVACHAFGILAKWLGQPRVVGEMIAGIILGPSLLGRLFPDLQAWLFPSTTKSALYLLSQLGLVLYMFTVGLEFDLGLVRKQLRQASAISLAGVIMPLVLGGTLAWSLRDRQDMFPGHASTLTIVLFLGAAMSVTAFPVLVRMLQEHKLIATPLGTLILAAGSIDDVIAWMLLALVLATISGSVSGAATALVGTVLFIGIMVILRKTLFARLLPHFQSESPNSALFALVLVLLMFSAWFTEQIGIHAVFGAFITGVMLPRSAFVSKLRSMVEPLAMHFLLPLFFVYSGLNTRFGLVNTLELWMLAGLIILVACAGKGIACWAAARLYGKTKRESVIIGALMNARGLMELIMLNIALSRGIIAPALFTIMALMAIITTLLASPVFRAVSRKNVAVRAEGEALAS